MEAFSCRLRATLLAQLLGCFGSDLSKDRMCSIEASVSGLTLQVLGNAKSTQSQLNLPEGLFELYTVQCGDNAVRLCTALSLLTECTRLITNIEQATATISYSAQCAILALTLEESNVMTVCELNCIDGVDHNEGGSLLEAFRSNVEVCQVIAKSDLLGDSVEEMIGTVGLSTVLVEIAQDSLKILAKGSGGASDIVLSKNVEGLLSFRCSESAEFVYLVDSFLLGIKALTTSHEVCIRINEEGVMYIQHQIVIPDGPAAFLNFLMLPLESE